MTRELRISIEASASAITFAPNGHLLATISPRKIEQESPSKIELWNPLNGALYCTIETFSDRDCSLVFSPDSLLLASGFMDGKIRICNSMTGELCRTLEGHALYKIRMIAFSPNSQFLASASDDTTARVWDITADIPHRAIQGHSIDVITVAFSPDGMLLASGSADGTVGIWNVLAGSLCHMLTGHSSEVRAVAFSPKVLLASASTDKTIRLWNTTTGDLYRIINAHLDRVDRVVFFTGWTVSCLYI